MPHTEKKCSEGFHKIRICNNKINRVTVPKERDEKKVAVSEQLVQDVVKEVVARLKIDADPTGNKGVFADMDTAIAAAKQAQKKVQSMSMDQREKIISLIRKKTKENAEILARMGVQETGMGNVGHKILKHHLVAERTPGTEDITTTAWSGDRGLT